MSRLKQEIAQNKPFNSLEEEAFLNMLRTVSVLSETMHEILRDTSISMPTYNVLRILRGAGPAGLPCKDVGERMVSRVPDVTRLLDRLERETLVSRQRSETDRRVVIARISDEGLALLERLDDPVSGAMVRRLGHMNEKQLTELIALLELARESPD